MFLREEDANDTLLVCDAIAQAIAGGRSVHIVFKHDRKAEFLHKVIRETPALPFHTSDIDQISVNFRTRQPEGDRMDRGELLYSGLDNTVEESLGHPL